MDVGEFHGRRLYTGHRLDYGLRLGTPTSTSHAISAVAKLVVSFSVSGHISTGMGIHSRVYHLSI